MEKNFTMINYKKVRDVKDPEIANEHDAGIDFFVPNGDQRYYLKSGESVQIKSGIHMEIPPGYVGLFRNKSSMGVKGIILGADVVDSGYTGEITINVHNISNEIKLITGGQKLVQMLILPKPKLALMQQSKDYEIKDFGSARGNKGFGSSGS